MGSLSGILQRPLIAAAAVGFASFSSDFSLILPSHKSESNHSSSDLSTSTTTTTTLSSDISLSKLASLSFISRIQVPVPTINLPIPNSHCNSLYSSVASSPALLKLYHSAHLAKAPNPAACKHDLISSSSTSVPDVSYTWHLPEPNALDVSRTSDCSSAKMRTVVVLLGWLGAKQKHLKRYADWYTSQGFHVITFTLPMADILKYQPGGKVEDHIDLLVTHLADWLEEEEQGKNLLFHTFSNTGWLTYGVMLEKFQKHDPSVMGRIRGCVVDSAPVAAPDPQVWASGFSAAFLKKHSVATKGTTDASESGMDALVDSKEVVAPKPAVTEAALLLVLEKFFEVVLNLPTVNRYPILVLGSLV